jgi:hypothetical protein
MMDASIANALSEQTLELDAGSVDTIVTTEGLEGSGQPLR